MENFDLSNYLVIPVIIACCMVGFIIKNFTGIKNKYIPGILLIVGALINCGIVLTDGSTVVVTTVLYGALSGLASSGIYDFFIKALLDKSKEVEKEIEKDIIDKIEKDNAKDTSEDDSETGDKR